MVTDDNRCITTGVYSWKKNPPRLFSARLISPPSTSWLPFFTQVTLKCDWRRHKHTWRHTKKWIYTNGYTNTMQHDLTVIRDDMLKVRKDVLRVRKEVRETLESSFLWGWHPSSLSLLYLPTLVPVPDSLVNCLVGKHAALRWCARLEVQTPLF